MSLLKKLTRQFVLLTSKDVRQLTLLSHQKFDLNLEFHIVRKNFQQALVELEVLIFYRNKQKTDHIDSTLNILGLPSLIDVADYKVPKEMDTIANQRNFPVCCQACNNRY
jgi:hypothetical protein